MMRSLLILLLISLPSIVFGEDISGTGWIFYEDDNDKKIILFEKNGTFTYLNVVASSGSEGKVYSDEDETWTVNGDTVVLIYNNGYKTCSLTINSRKDWMSGTCINKTGLVEQVTGWIIE